MSSPQDQLASTPGPRRDLPPHRGDLLRVLGMVSALISMLTCLVLPGLIALPLGLATWLMARHDLRLMESGQMDREGMPATLAARRRGVSAVVTVLLLWLLVACALLLRHLT